MNAHASFPGTPVAAYEYRAVVAGSTYGPWATDHVATCEAAVQLKDETTTDEYWTYEYVGVDLTSTTSHPYGKCLYRYKWTKLGNHTWTYTAGSFARRDAPFSCPANATLSGQTCTCDAGHSEVDRQCVPSVVETISNPPPDRCMSGEPSFGNPIFPLTGAKREFVSVGIRFAAVDFTLTYDSTARIPSDVGAVPTILVEPAAFGLLWKSNLHHKLQILAGRKKALLSRGDGAVLNFTGDGTGAFTGDTGNPHKLVKVPLGYRFTDFDTGDQEMFDFTGKPVSVTLGGGGYLNFIYSGDNLVKVAASDGRMVRFAYSNGVVTQITGPDGSVIAVGYDAAGNLTSLTWPDGKAHTFLYENGDYPWALTGKVDENNVRYATFGYDDQGRAISSEYSGGVNKYIVSYGGAPPLRRVNETFDAGQQIRYRTISWQSPAGTVVTRPDGQTVGIEATDVAGAPRTSSQSQPAGSGCTASASALSYDANGNIASRDDFAGQRTCFVYDGANRETVRIEGLASTIDCASVTPVGATLPAGARRITTVWHPDWRKPVQVDEPLRRTVHVYHGQPDAFNNGMAAHCTSAPAMPDGKPLPLLCKRVEQALTSGGAIDPVVPARTNSYSYDSAGRVLTSTDASNRTTAYVYYPDTVFSGVAGDSYDPHFNDVSLLLRPYGGDGSTAFMDGAPNPSVVRAYGNARVSSAQSKFGGTSAYFDGNGDYLAVPMSTAFLLSRSGATFEAWFYIAGDSSADGSGLRRAALLSTYNASSPAYFDLLIDGNATTTGTGFILQWKDATGTLQSRSVGGLAISKGAWHHIAVSISPEATVFYIDGVRHVTAPLTIDVDGPEVESLWIGRDIPWSPWYRYFNGYIDELRITKGVGRYPINLNLPAGELPAQDPTFTASSIGHMAGDLQSVINAAGHVVQFNAYDPAGRMLQMVDAKGVVTDIAYTPRGLVSAVTVTPPGGSPRATTYTYDGVGQVTGVSHPDGTTLTYSYDAAHRLTGITDARGNSVTYTLDNTGNRISEEVRDPGGALQRAIGRSFDALNRLQQVTGAAQ